MAAPGKPGVTVTGATELRRALRRFDDRVTDIDPVAVDAAEIIEARALELVPVMDGVLRGSIRVEGYQGGAVVEAGGDNVPYAWVIHFGWKGHGIEPQPFLYDASDERYQAVLAKYDDKVDKEIRRLDREAPK